MRKIVIAIDSFKGSLSTFEAGAAIKEAAECTYQGVEAVVSPVADGGEGTVDAIISASGGEYVKVLVSNPLGKPVEAVYGIIQKTKTAVIEMSAAAGITLISAEERNPLLATTFGVGEMIKDAIGRGCRQFIIGIGGSATNDGGLGMLDALGFDFLDKNEMPVSLGAKGLKDITKIKTQNAIKELKECTFCVACDVKNVLCGANGCSAVYGPQKGATPEMIRDMDAWLLRFAEQTKKVFPEADENLPGAGAAGGLGFALTAYLGATLTSGIELVMRATELEEKIKDADLVITGEGRLDGQSSMGKVPVGVASLAQKYKKPVIAFSGCVTEDAVVCNEYGIDAFFPIVRKPCSLEEAMDISTAYRNLKDTAYQVFRLIRTKI